MKYLLLILMTFTFELMASDLSVKKRAVIRDDHFDAIIAEVVLPDLISDNSYEGKYFKIVNGKNDEAVRFDDSEDLQLKAATTYFHLNKARKYFIDTVHSAFVQNLPKLTIRLELINVFNEVGHFGNENLNPQYNNALTVPAGAGYEPKDIKAWNTEIWFRPSKIININDFKGPVDLISVKGSLTTFRNQTHMVNLERFITSVLQGGVADIGTTGSIMRLVGSSVLAELLYQSSDLAAEFFTRKIYRLDSALVPEIIYHEYSHVALSDHLELSHSTPVNEGLADFFAGKIAKSKKLATNIKEYNLFNGKAVRKKQQYRIAFERGEYANTDFVFGLLWSVGEVVGPDREDMFMYQMTNKINTNASIRDELIEATLNTCKDICHNPMNDRIRLYKLYQSKNI